MLFQQTFGKSAYKVNDKEERRKFVEYTVRLYQKYSKKSRVLVKFVKNI